MPSVIKETEIYKFITPFGNHPITIYLVLNYSKMTFSLRSAKSQYSIHETSFEFTECKNPEFDAKILETMLEATNFAKEKLKEAEIMSK